MKDILLNIRDGFASSTPLDLANLALGVVGVVLMVRRSLWAFPIGLLAVSVQGVLFFENRFYADATVQVFFFAALAYGWWHWVRDKGAAPELPVTRQSWRGRALTLALAGVATVCGALDAIGHAVARCVYRGIQRGGAGAPGPQADRKLAAVDRGQPRRHRLVLAGDDGIYGVSLRDLSGAGPARLARVVACDERRDSGAWLT